jgi:hypothetical protein
VASPCCLVRVPVPAQPGPSFPTRMKKMVGSERIDCPSRERMSMQIRFATRASVYSWIDRRYHANSRKKHSSAPYAQFRSCALSAFFGKSTKRSPSDVKLENESHSSVRRTPLKLLLISPEVNIKMDMLQNPNRRTFTNIESHYFGVVATKPCALPTYRSD